MTTQLSAVVNFPGDTNGTQEAAFVAAIQQLFASVDPANISNPVVTVTTNVAIGTGAAPLTNVSITAAPTPTPAVVTPA